MLHVLLLKINYIMFHIAFCIFFSEFANGVEELDINELNPMNTNISGFSLWFHAHVKSNRTIHEQQIWALLISYVNAKSSKCPSVTVICCKPSAIIKAQRDVYFKRKDSPTQMIIFLIPAQCRPSATTPCHLCIVQHGLRSARLRGSRGLPMEGRRSEESWSGWCGKELKHEPQSDPPNRPKSCEKWQAGKHVYRGRKP